MTTMTAARDAHLSRYPEYLDGTLPADEQAAYDRHLETCVDCQRRLSAAAGDSHLWHALPTHLAGTPAEAPPLAALIDELTANRPTDAFATDRTDLGPAEPAAPERIDHYEIRGVLGRGGMGVVYLGHDLELRRQVALKVLAPPLAAHETARRRFVREARAAAAVRHPNVAAVHAVRGDLAQPYLVMEYVPGGTLQDRLDRGVPFAVADVVRIGRQVAAGLAAAHHAGLVHRDVKPANVLIEEPGGTAKLADFGLARAVDDATVSLGGTVIGTPEYMSPEQASAKPVDQRADLFGLGCVLYALCSGRPPFRAEGALAVMRQVVEAEPEPVRSVAPHVPQPMAALIHRLLEKHPAARPASAAEVAGTLAAWEDNPGRLATSARPHRRRRLVTGVVAVALAAVLALAAPLVIKIDTPDGTLVIKSEDKVRVTVEKDGTVVIEPTEQKEIRLGPGDYAVKLDAAGRKARREFVHVRKGERTVLEVALEPAGGGQPALGPADGEPRPLREFVGHTSPVRDIVMTRDGTGFFSCTESLTGGLWDDVTALVRGPAARGNTIRQWDLATGKVVREFAGHQTSVNQLALSPDGATLYSCGWDHTARAWDVATGHERYKLDHPTDGVLSIAVSADGKRLLTGGANGSAWVWDTASGKQVLTLNGYSGIHAVAFSPDGDRAVAGGSGHIVVWDVRTGTELRRVEAFKPAAGEWIDSVAFSPDGRRLVTAGPRVSIWTWDDLTEQRSLPHDALRARFTLDGRSIVSGGYDGRIRLWDAATGEQRHWAPAQGSWVRALTFTPDGTLLSGIGCVGDKTAFRKGDDFTIRLWELPADAKR